MRVVAFWTAIVGLVVVVGESVVLAPVPGVTADVRETVSLVAAIAQIVFTALLVVVLLIIAVTGRRP
jgi:hypothetical protein